MVEPPPLVRLSRWEVESLVEVEDELDAAAASSDHFAAMSSEELCMMRMPCCVSTMTGSQRESRGEVLRFVLQTVQRMLMPKDHVFYVVQLLDAAGIWSTTNDFRQQTLAGMAALIVSVKVRCNPVRDVGVDALPELADLATQFLTAHRGALSPEDIVVQERDLLIAFDFVVPLPLYWIGWRSCSVLQRCPQLAE